MGRVEHARSPSSRITCREGLCRRLPRTHDAEAHRKRRGRAGPPMRRQSLSGLILLFMLAAYAALVYWVATRLKRAWVRWLIVLVAVFGPFVESTIARIRMASLCRAEFGVHYLRPVTDLDGLYVDGRFADYSFRELRSLKLTYQEYRLEDGSGYGRRSIGPGNEELQEIIEKPTARYEFRDLKPVILSGGIGRNEVQLVDRSNGEVVAYGRQFTYSGDWSSRLLRRSHLPAYSGIDCGGDVTVWELLAPALKTSTNLATGDRR